MVLDAAAMNALFLPEGVAHGFLTLTDDAALIYQMGPQPSARTGQRPALG